MKQLLLFLFSIFLLSSCQNNGTEERPSITFSTNRNLMAPLEITQIGETQTKEIKLKSSEKTVFSPGIKERTLFMLQIPGRKLKAPLSVGVDEAIKIHISDKTLSGYQVEGSEESEKLAQFHEAMLKTDLKMQQHMRKIMNSARKGDFSTTRQKALKAMETGRDTLQRIAVSIIEDEPGALSNIIILQQTFGDQNLLPVETFTDIHEKVASGLTESYPGNATAQEYQEKIRNSLERLKEKKQALQKTQPGNQAPNLRLPENDNKLVSLGNIDNKVVLVFWKPDDKETVNMIRKLKELLNQHQNLHVYAVSIYPNVQLWEQTAPNVKRWINVTEPNGLDASSAKTYGINSTPVFFLLDEEQIITARTKSVDEIADAIR